MMSENRMPNSGRKKTGKVFLVGAGPGGIGDMTGRAVAAIRECEVLCGYTVYIGLILDQMPQAAGKRILTTPMRQEMERCRAALEEASLGRSVAMICSGDAGVYGMAGPVLALQSAYPDVETEIIPGVTAAVSGAAVLGAPLMNDFCVLSLSDLLTPWETIEKRLRAAAAGDFTAVLYNPMSKKRTGHLRHACEIFLEYRAADTACGWVRNIGRDGQEKRLLTLEELRDEKVDMFTTIYIGCSSMRKDQGRLIAPRGYAGQREAEHEDS